MSCRQASFSRFTPLCETCRQELQVFSSPMYFVESGLGWAFERGGFASDASLYG